MESSVTVESIVVRGQICRFIQANIPSRPLFALPSLSWKFYLSIGYRILANDDFSPRRARRRRGLLTGSWLVTFQLDRPPLRLVLRIAIKAKLTEQPEVIWLRRWEWISERLPWLFAETFKRNSGTLCFQIFKRVESACQRKFNWFWKYARYNTRLL